MYGVRFPEHIAASAGLAEGKLRRRHGRGEMIHVVASVRSKAGFMGPGLSLAENLKAAAVQLHATQMPLARIIGIGGDVQGSGIVIDSVDGEDLKVTFGDLVLEPGFPGKRVVLIERVKIKVGVAVAPA